MKPSFALSLIASLLLLSSCQARLPYSQQAASGGGSSAPIASKRSDIVTRGDIPADAVPIKVALLVPLSGESIAVGNAMLDAATMALYDSYLAVPSNQIRSQIILMPKDTGNTAAEAAAAARQSIDQGATIIVGPLFSQAVSAVAPLAKERNVPMITFSNTKAVAEKDVYVFGFMPEQQVIRMAEYAYLHKYQRVAVLAPNDTYGEKVKDTLAETYFRKGGVVSPGELYAPSPANIDAAVSRVAASYNNTPEERRFQGIFIADGGYQLKNIISSLKKTNLDLKKIKLFGTGLWDDPEITKIPELHGAWFPSAPPDAYKNFERRFMAIYGYKPARLSSLSYDAITLLAQLSLPTTGDGINAATLTAEQGFISPANGLFRLKPDGTSERRLNVMEVTPDEFKIIDLAPAEFSK